MGRCFAKYQIIAKLYYTLLITLEFSIKTFFYGFQNIFSQPNCLSDDVFTLKVARLPI